MSDWVKVEDSYFRKDQVVHFEWMDKNDSRIPGHGPAMCVDTKSEGRFWVNCPKRIFDEFAESLEVDK